MDERPSTLKSITLTTRTLEKSIVLALILWQEHIRKLVYCPHQDLIISVRLFHEALNQLGHQTPCGHILFRTSVNSVVEM